jgi:hypothetical protein
VLVVSVWRLRKLVLRKVQTRSEVGVKSAIFDKPNRISSASFCGTALEIGIWLEGKSSTGGNWHSVLCVIADHSICGHYLKKSKHLPQQQSKVISCKICETEFGLVNMHTTQSVSKRVRKGLLLIGLPQ